MAAYALILNLLLLLLGSNSLFNGKNQILPTLE